MTAFGHKWSFSNAVIQQRRKLIEALIAGSSGRVDDKSIHGPWVVLPFLDVLPSRQTQAIDVRTAILYSVTMHVHVGTNHLNIHEVRVGLDSNVLPLISR